MMRFSRRKPDDKPDVIIAIASCQGFKEVKESFPVRLNLFALHTLASIDQLTKIPFLLLVVDALIISHPLLERISQIASTAVGA